HEPSHNMTQNQKTKRNKKTSGGYSKKKNKNKKMGGHTKKTVQPTRGSRAARRKQPPPPPPFLSRPRLPPELWSCQRPAKQTDWTKNQNANHDDIDREYFQLGKKDNG